MKPLGLWSRLPASLALLAIWPGHLLSDDLPDGSQLAADAAGHPQAPRTALSLRWENDALVGRDENYSNGISLSLAEEGRGLLGGIWNWFGATDGRRISGFELSQVIVTPADISRPIPDPADRPYAGLLYGALTTQLAYSNRFHGLKMMIGVVGPASLAEQTQTWVHRQIGSGEPQGWDYQLQNEPILNLVYDYRRRYPVLGADGGWGAEIIPMGGGMLGNVLIQASAGVQLRLGYNLPDDFGTTQMRGLGNTPFPLPRTGTPGQRTWGAYLFAGGAANLVAHNLTLDGNTFRDSPSVDKKPFFPGGEFGLSVWCRYFQATFSYVFWGREFETQARNSQFTVLTLTAYF